MKSRPKKDQKMIFLSVEQFNSSTRPKNFGGLKGKSKKKASLYVKFCVSYQLPYKYIKKVKLNPNTFSEIIELQENGASGGIQT